MNLKNIVIVLDHPDESRNIGAACRAMANNDISDLRIVGNIEDYDIEHIHVLAIHAGPLFDNAKFYNSIKEATADCSICAGTTRRRGKKRGKLLLPEEFAKMAGEVLQDQEPDCQSTAQQEAQADGPRQPNSEQSTKVAVVFGNERTGLTDQQLDECNLGVCIPSSDNFGSLNLSHAVQIISYHLFRENMAQTKGPRRGFTPLTLDRVDKTVQIITDNMKKIGFFKMPGREDMENFWRSILSRASLSEGEAQYLEKTFCKMSGLASKNASGNQPVKKYKHIIFDLDNTLYPASSDMSDGITRRMMEKVAEFFHCSMNEAEALRKEKMVHFSTTQEWLRSEGMTDIEGFLAHVHPDNEADELQPQPGLREFLISLNIPMSILTNAPHEHADRVLAKLGIADLFVAITDIRDTDFNGKPYPMAYEAALKKAGAKLESTLFLDDMQKYTDGWVAMGGTAILIGDYNGTPLSKDAKAMKGITPVPGGRTVRLPSIYQLPEFLNN